MSTPANTFRRVNLATAVMVPCLVTAAFGQNVIGPTDFQSCSTNLTLNASNNGSLSCNAVIDGDTSGSALTFNEFFGQLPGGTYRFEFVQDFDLTDFYLWNDRGFPDSGIADFELTFYNAAVVPIGSHTDSASTTFMGSAPTPEVFNFGSTIPSVRYVDLDIFTSLAPGANTQFREIAFNAIPEPSSCGVFLAGLLLMCRRFWLR